MNGFCCSLHKAPPSDPSAYLELFKLFSCFNVAQKMVTNQSRISIATAIRFHQFSSLRGRCLGAWKFELSRSLNETNQ